MKRGFLLCAEREGLIRYAHPSGKSMLTFHPTRGGLTLRRQKKLPRFPKTFLAAERVGLIRYAHPFGGGLTAFAVLMPVGMSRTLCLGSNPSQMKKATLIL